jgi:MFS family permease
MKCGNRMDTHQLWSRVASLSRREATTDGKGGMVQQRNLSGVFAVNEYTTLYRGWVLLLLMLAYMSSYIDRSILGILQEPIKHELGLTDSQLGLLGGLSFALFYTLLGIPIARLAERRNRAVIISIALVVWSAMTGLCGLTAGYAQLLLCRIGVGVGEAGGTPAAHSIITDVFKPERRASALAIYSLGVPLGSLIGAAGGGALAQQSGWRAAFLFVGPPGILIALLIATTLREPKRGQSESKPTTGLDTVPSLRVVLRLLFGNRVFVHIAAGASLVVLSGYSIGLFMAPLFLRQFGLGIQTVGLISGMVNGVAAGIGIVMGGFLTDIVGKRNKSFYAWLPAVCLALAAPLFAISFLQHAWLPMTLLLMLSTCLIYTYYAPTFAMMHNIVEPRMRATAASILFLMMNMIGLGIGPSIVGAASDFFSRRAFQGGVYESMCPHGRAATASTHLVAQACQSASGTGLKYALVLCGAICLWAAIHFALAGIAIKRSR